jgi:hypothetical protein
MGRTNFPFKLIGTLFFTISLKYKTMNIYVEFYDSVQPIKNNEVGLGITEMNFNDIPKKGDEITLSFPSHYIKNNKWFAHIPENPWKIESVFDFGDGGTKAFVFYCGEENIDLKKIKQTRFK